MTVAQIPYIGVLIHSPDLTFCQRKAKLILEASPVRYVKNMAPYSRTHVPLGLSLLFSPISTSIILSRSKRLLSTRALVLRLLGSFLKATSSLSFFRFLPKGCDLCNLRRPVLAVTCKFLCVLPRFSSFVRFLYGLIQCPHVCMSSSQALSM